MNNEIKEIIKLSTSLVLSRDSDVNTEDGSFATVDTDLIIRLEQAIVKAFDLPYDDVSEEDVPIISAILNNPFFRLNKR